MYVKWNKCVGKVWCDFLSLDLEDPHFNDLGGVYIIWHRGKGLVKSATVRVGQGDIKDRIATHRNDPKILAYKNYGLYVTWAFVLPTFRDGVERYLANSLRPKVGDVFPSVMPISVNLPW